MRILTIGDVCSPDGVKALLCTLPKIKREFSADLCIVNGENSALGNGITPESAMDIFAAGAHVITGGNHSLRRKEIYPLLEENPFLLRPHNIEGEAGSGYCLVDLGRTNAAIINLSGQIYLDSRISASNPFTCADSLIERAKAEGAKNIIVDFHAEATSEKRALGFYLDGRVTALFGTHTHVQTSDAQILPKGTGYITDLGMTGAVRSVLGIRPEQSVETFLGGLPGRYQTAGGACKLQGAIFELDSDTGLCVGVERIDIR